MIFKITAIRQMGMHKWHLESVAFICPVYTILVHWKHVLYDSRQLLNICVIKNIEILAQ